MLLCSIFFRCEVLVSIFSLQVAQNCPQEIFNSENFALITMELCLNYFFKVFQRYLISSDWSFNAVSIIWWTFCIGYIYYAKVPVYLLSSTDTISVTHPNSEVNVIQTLCSTTKAIINRIETKVCLLPMILDNLFLSLALSFCQTSIIMNSWKYLCNILLQIGLLIYLL